LLQPILLTLTVKSIALFATLMGLPHDVQGFLVYIGGRRYIVAEACSGLAYVTLAIFLGYSFGCLLYRSFARIAGLALFSAFLGVACNIARVNAIVSIDWMRGTQMDLAAHGNIQWIALFATLMVLFYVLSRLEGDPATPAAPVASAYAADKAIGVRKFAPVLAATSALLVTAGAIALPASEVGPPREPRSLQISSVSGWRLVNPQATWSVTPRGSTQSIRLTFASGSRDVDVVIVETLVPDAKLSESDLGPVDDGFSRHGLARVEEGCADSACTSLLHATWERDHGRQTRHAYYALSVGDFTSVSSSAVRVAYAWRRLTRQRDGQRLIGFVAEGAALDVNEVAANFEMLQTALNGPPGMRSGDHAAHPPMRAMKANADR